MRSHWLKIEILVQYLKFNQKCLENPKIQKYGHTTYMTHTSTHTSKYIEMTHTSKFS